MSGEGDQQRLDHSDQRSISPETSTEGATQMVSLLKSELFRSHAELSGMLRLLGRELLHFHDKDSRLLIRARSVLQVADEVRRDIQNKSWLLEDTRSNEPELTTSLDKAKTEGYTVDTNANGSDLQDSENPDTKHEKSERVLNFPSAIVRPVAKPAASSE